MTTHHESTAPVSIVYTAVDPYRVLDTRDTGGTAGGSVVTVDTRLGDVGAAAVQITVADAAGAGFLTAWSEPDPQPATSVLNFRQANDVNGNFVIVPVSHGTFRIYASETTGIIVDVMGFTSEQWTTTPTRIADSRTGGGTPADTTISVQTPLPPGTPTASVQITVADTSGPGFLTAWSGVGRRPETSVLNYGPGDLDGNFVIVPLAPDATFAIYTLAGAGIIVDLMGAPHDYTPTRSQRVLDTRHAGGSAAGSVVRVETNLNPSVSAIGVQITAADASAPGYLTVWSGDGAAPEVSALNYGSTRHADGNFVIVPVHDGGFSVYTLADTGIVVDVMGYTGALANVSYDVPDPNASTLLPADVPIGDPDLTFEYGSHPLQTVDVYRGSTGQTLVWLHGGGWEGGDKTLEWDAEMSNFNRVPRLLRADGWTIVSVNYRLSPEVHLDDIVSDFYFSLIAVTQHLEAWNVDLGKIVVGGFSSGAHICGLGSAARNQATFDPPPGLPPIQAMVAQDGNMMTSLFAAGVPPGTLDPDGNDLSPAPAIARLLDCPGWSFGACSAEAITRSDITTYSDASDPPLYLIGATHSLIPFDVQTQTRDMVRATGQVVVFDGVDTGPESLRLHDVQGLNWAALRAFLEAVTS